MAKEDWWFKFEHLKWLTDEQLNRCSLETQGFWMRCICMMRKADSAKIEGTAPELARLLGVTPAELKRCFAELNLTKTATVTQTAKNFTLMSRKFARELKVKEQNRLRKARERRHAAVTVMSQDRVKSKSKEKEKKEEKELPTEVKKETPPPARKPAHVPTRIPQPFALTPERWAWLAENVPGLDDPNAAHADFVEHWTNAPPGKAEKLNWELTWQKGMRLAFKWQERDKQANGTNHTGKLQRSGQRSSSLERIADHADILSEYPTEAELAERSGRHS